MKVPSFLRFLFVIGIILFLVLLLLGIVSLILKNNNIEKIHQNILNIFESYKIHKIAL